MNNLPIVLRLPDYIGRQGALGLIPYTLGETVEWV
jgi:hypothetical protein